MWEGDKAVMLDGALTPYGRTLYGTDAAVENGVLAGALGAAVGSVLWALAYAGTFDRRRGGRTSR